jgi:hypothetical protein
MSYRVGETGPAGGFIFFVDQDGTFADFDYLEAAPAGWNGAGSDPQLELCLATGPRDADLATWGAQALGAGASNTATLQADGCGGAVGSVSALEIVVDGVTYADWYVPSIAELVLMVETARRWGAVPFVLSGNYASSSLSEPTRFFTYALNNRSGGSAPIGEAELHVRPVRRFSEPSP